MPVTMIVALVDVPACIESDAGLVVTIKSGLGTMIVIVTLCW